MIRMIRPRELTMVVWSQADTERVERRLRDLIAAGSSIAEAVRIIHRGDGLGLLWICPAVATIARLASIEAQRLVVRAVPASSERGLRSG